MEIEQPLIFKKIYSDSIIPSKATSGACGYDLFCYTDKPVTILPMEKEMIHTGIKVKLPRYSYGRVAPKSGLTWKKFVDIGAGVIDEDYRGEVMVIVFNFSKEPVTFNKGEKVAQLIIEKIVPTKPIIYEPGQELDITDRNEKGFGSTGI